MPKEFCHFLCTSRGGHSHTRNT